MDFLDKSVEAQFESITLLTVVPKEEKKADDQNGRDYQLQLRPLYGKLEDNQPALLYYVFPKLQDGDDEQEPSLLEELKSQGGQPPTFHYCTLNMSSSGSTYAKDVAAGTKILFVVPNFPQAILFVARNEGRYSTAVLAALVSEFALLTHVPLGKTIGDVFPHILDRVEVHAGSKKKLSRPATAHPLRVPSFGFELVFDLLGPNILTEMVEALVFSRRIVLLFDDEMAGPASLALEYCSFHLLGQCLTSAYDGQFMPVCSVKFVQFLFMGPGLPVCGISNSIYEHACSSFSKENKQDYASFKEIIGSSLIVRLKTPTSSGGLDHVGIISRPSLSVLPRIKTDVPTILRSFKVLILHRWEEVKGLLAERDYIMPTCLILHIGFQLWMSGALDNRPLAEPRTACQTLKPLYGQVKHALIQPGRTLWDIFLDDVRLCAHPEVHSLLLDSMMVENVLGEFSFRAAVERVCYHTLQFTPDYSDVHEQMRESLLQSSSSGVQKHTVRVQEEKPVHSGAASNKSSSSSKRDEKKPPKLSSFFIRLRRRKSAKAVLPVVSEDEAARARKRQENRDDDAVEAINEIVDEFVEACKRSAEVLEQSGGQSPLKITKEQQEAMKKSLAEQYLSGLLTISEEDVLRALHEGLEERSLVSKNTRGLRGLLGGPQPTALMARLSSIYSGAQLERCITLIQRAFPGLLDADESQLALMDETTLGNRLPIGLKNVILCRH